MLLKSFRACLLSLVFVSPAVAGLPCPDSSYVTVSFSRTYTGDYNPGQPYDYVTIAPDGSGETFAATGITIRVYARFSEPCGSPTPGIPRQEIVLFNPNLCLCPGGNIADHDTDANGCTEFTGTLAGGGCADNLTVYIDGVAIGTVPVKINSTDALPATPCHTDASDVSALGAHFRKRVGEDGYSICFDYNEDGGINAGDLSFFAAKLGSDCAP